MHAFQICPAFHIYEQKTVLFSLVIIEIQTKLYDFKKVCQCAIHKLS